MNKMKRKVIFIILVTWSIVVCISCQRVSNNNKETNGSDTEQKKNDNINYANKKDTTKNIRLFSQDIATLKNKVEELETARNDNDNRLKTLADSEANKYFYIIAIMACLGLIAFLCVILLHQKLKKNEKEIIRNFDEIDEEFKKVNIEMKHLKQTPSGKVASTSSLSAEIEKLRIEICSIKKRIGSDSSSIMPSQHSLQKNETDTHPKHINEGYVDDVKGNDENGYFAGFNPTQSNDSCYHIFNIKGNMAEFKAIDFKSINGHNSATKAVVFSGVERKDATNIEKQVSGVVEMSDDGYWEIIKKAQIILI